MRLIISIAIFVKKIFYAFLDVSGILLGIFLFWLGIWMVAGKPVPKIVSFIVIFLGISAFLIHMGHYFSWKLTRWIFGSEDYFKTRDRK